MNPTHFLFYNVTGCILWVGSLVSAGYFLGNTQFVQENFGLIVYMIIFVSILPIVIEVVRAWLRKSKQ